MTQEQAGSYNDTLKVHISVEEANAQTLTFLKTDTVSEVFQIIDSLPDVHHHTSFNLLYQSKILDQSTLLADLLSSVNQNSLNFEMKNKVYDEKSIMEHVLKARDIVGLRDPVTFGLNSGVSKINELGLDPIPKTLAEETKVKDENGEAGTIEAPALTDKETSQVKESVSTFFGKLPPSYFTSTPVITPTVRGLYLSSWNPVPLNLKAKGHLLYIFLQTLEGDSFHITGTPSGFYLNKSSSNKFDPSPRENAEKSFTLCQLIHSNSKNFHVQAKKNRENLAKIDPITFLRPQTTFLKAPWITKAPAPVPDFGKTQFEDHTQRDFNDEYQTIKEFPTENVSDRIIRERLLAKTAFEFTENAVKGALSVLAGGIAPMDLTENKSDQIFLHNGIFYSFGVDASGTFESKGGNYAARAASNQDLKAVKYWNTIDARGIYTLLTTIVDYAGKRVICQTPVPGLFTSSEPNRVKNEETGEYELVEGEPLSSTDYGYDDLSGSFKPNPDYIKALEPIRKAIHYKRVKTEDGKGEIVTNSQIKGITGTDKRKYVLELYDTTPLDVEFTDEHFNPEEEDSYPHKQAVMRIEAVQEWYAHNVRELVKNEAEKKKIDLSAPLKDGEEPPVVTIDDETLAFTPNKFESDESVRSVSKFVKDDLIPRFLDQYDSISSLIPVDGAYLSTTMHNFGINMRYLGYLAQVVEKRIQTCTEEEEKLFNENVELNKAHDAKVESVKKELQEKLKAKAEAAASGENLPHDGIEELRKELEELEKDEEVTGDDDLSVPVTKSKQYKGLFAVIIQELIARASKHILRSYSETLPLLLDTSLVSHFHNCLLGQAFNGQPKAQVDDIELYNEEELSFTKLTPESVVELITKDVKIWYRYDLPTDWNAKFVRPSLTQREIALKFGIQWQQRVYHFTKESYEEAQKLNAKDKKSKKSKSVSPTPALSQLNVFNPEDISFTPLIKDSVTHSLAAEQILEHGRGLALNDDEVKREEGLALINESISVYEQVYGQIHPEVAKVYATVSQLYQDVGLKREAAAICRRAVELTERTFGLDSHDTLVVLLNLAYLEASVGNYPNSIKVYALITQIWTSIYDNQHVSISTVISNSTVYLQNLGLYKEANQLLKKLINLSTDVHGETAYTTGFLRFRHAYLLAQEEKFEESLKEARAANDIVRDIVTYRHSLSKQTLLLYNQLVHYQAITKQNKIIEQQKLKETTKENIAKSNGKSLKQTSSQRKFENKSVDEVLKYVLSGESLKNIKNKGSKK